MLLYKTNDSTWALNPVPSLLLNDSPFLLSLHSMKLSFLTAHSHHRAIIGSFLYCKTPWKILSLLIIFIWYMPSVIESLEITLSTLTKQILSKSLMTFKLPHKKQILISHWTQFLNIFWNNWSCASSRNTLFPWLLERCSLLFFGFFCYLTSWLFLVSFSESCSFSQSLSIRMVPRSDFRLWFSICIYLSSSCH